MAAALTRRSSRRSLRWTFGSAASSSTTSTHAEARATSSRSPTSGCVTPTCQGSRVAGPIVRAAARHPSTRARTTSTSPRSSWSGWARTSVSTSIGQPLAAPIVPFPWRAGQPPPSPPTLAQYRAPYYARALLACRVFVGGFSNGGQFAYQLNCQLSQLFAGLASTAPSPPFLSLSLCLGDSPAPSSPPFLSLRRRNQRHARWHGRYTWRRLLQSTAPAAGDQLLRLHWCITTPLQPSLCSGGMLSPGHNGTVLSGPCPVQTL